MSASIFYLRFSKWIKFQEFLFAQMSVDSTMKYHMSSISRQSNWLCKLVWFRFQWRDDYYYYSILSFEQRHIYFKVIITFQLRVVFALKRKKGSNQKSLMNFSQFIHVNVRLTEQFDQKPKKNSFSPFAHTRADTYWNAPWSNHLKTSINSIKVYGTQRMPHSKCSFQINLLQWLLVRWKKKVFLLSHFSFCTIFF